METLGYILLVDDSENDTELTKRALSRAKVVNDIVVVRDGAEAIDFLFRSGNFKDRQEADPILILLDIKMPKVNGIEVLALLKKDQNLQRIPTVMLTSSRQGPDVEECYRYGANAYVTKPVDFEQFAEAVRVIGKFWAVLNELPHKNANAASSGQ